MKNLNLENYGVQEMNVSEMMNVDGGAAGYDPKAWAKGAAYVGLVAGGIGLATAAGPVIGVVALAGFVASCVGIELL